ncbi:MAG TPA: hypothetical protein VGX00_03770 [Thermoplasmata archaeon]|nr:hypothetical protein [Thermoplasmata archaeon]
MTALPRAPRWTAAVLPLLPLLLVLLVEGVVGRIPRVAGLAIPIVGIGVSEAARRWASAAVGPLWVVPAIAAAGTMSAFSGVSFASEGLGALSGLSVLYWLGGSAAGSVVRPRPAAGLVFPALAVGIALTVVQFLPGGPANLGLASGLLILLLVALGWAIAADPKPKPTGAASS